MERARGEDSDATSTPANESSDNALPTGGGEDEVDNQVKVEQDEDGSSDLKLQAEDENLRQSSDQLEEEAAHEELMPHKQEEEMDELDSNDVSDREKQKRIGELSTQSDG